MLGVMEWYYTKEGKQTGPIAFEELQRLAAQGQLLPGDFVWKQGMQNWQPAREINGLFAGLPGVPPPGPGAAAGTDEAPAGFWARAGARVIDNLILAIPGIVLTLIVPRSSGLGGAVVRMIFGFAISGVYFTWMIGTYGQTLGKMAIGAKVVMMDGSPVPTSVAALRWFGYLVDGITLFIGYIIAAFTDQKRGLHDYIAGTRVVYLPENRATLGAVIGAVTLGLFPVAVGLLAAIAIPKFAQLTQQAKEGATKGSLGSMRAALSIYYGDSEGRYPGDPNELTVGKKYLAIIPYVKTANHADTNRFEAYGNEICGRDARGSAAIDGSRLRDSGAWGYVADKNSPCWGSVFVDCTHTDSRGTAWFSY